MALTKDQKKAVIDEVSELLNSSKMTVVAKYQGTTVKSIQDLRLLVRDNGTKVKVVKNRLFKKALEGNKTLKDVDSSLLEGQLLYAFNSEDEVADEVKALAGLPSRDELIAQVVATLSSPVNDIMNGLSGNLHALLDGIEAKASN
jgi:large subunit ribosomal protein L10